LAVNAGYRKIEIDPELAAAAADRLKRRTRAGDDGRRLGAEGRALQAEARRQEFLAAYRDRPHASITDVLAACGFTWTQYSNWRLKHAEFASEVDGIREGARRPEYHHGFERWRMDFLGRQTFDHQRRIINIIETAPPRTAHLVLVPPEAGKTTLLLEYFVYRICMTPAIRTQLWSKSPDEAEKRVMKIANMLIDHSATRGADGTPGKLIGRFGPFYTKGQERAGRPWRRDAFRVWKAPVDEVDYTCQAYGINAPTQGTRAELIGIDDPQDIKNINDSPKILRKIRQEASTRLTRNGVLIWVATRVEVNDVYDLMFTLPEEDVFLSSVTMIPALTPEGESYAPDMWPLPELQAAMRLAGAEATARCYLMNPLQAGREPFAEAAMKAARKADLMWGTTVPGMPAILTVDPGLAPTGVAAFLVSSVTEEMGLRLVEFAKHLDYVSAKDFTDEIERLLIAHPSIKYLAIERNNFQKILLTDPVLLQLIERYGLEIMEHVTSPLNKNAHDLGVTAVGRQYARGRIEIPDKGLESHDMFQGFVDQHIKWRPGVPDKILKQDAVIVGWMAWLIKEQVEAAIELERKREQSKWKVHQGHSWGQMRKRAS